MAVALRMLCARPLFRHLDLQSARFVVSKACGITIDGKWYGIGEEIPPGSLTPYALECNYERPLCYIDTLEYAWTIDELRVACEAHGVQLETPPAAASSDTVVKPDLDALDHRGLASLCDLYGLNSLGNRKQLRQRIENFLAAQ